MSRIYTTRGKKSKVIHASSHVSISVLKYCTQKTVDGNDVFGFFCLNVSCSREAVLPFSEGSIRDDSAGERVTCVTD